MEVAKKDNANPITVPARTGNERPGVERRDGKRQPSPPYAPVLFAGFLIGLSALNVILFTLYHVAIISSLAAFHFFNAYLLVTLLLWLIVSSRAIKRWMGGACRPLRNAVIGLGGGAVGFMASLAVKWLFFKSPGEPLVLSFDFSFFQCAMLAYYLASSFIQETVIRAFCQNHLSLLFRRFRRPAAYSILVVSLVFALSHIIHGPMAALAMFGFAIVMGVVYQLTRSLAVVVCIHFFAGVGFFFIP